MTLKDRYSKYFKVGAAVNAYSIEKHADLITAQFSTITCDNALKPDGVTPDGINYDFSTAEKQIKFARENGMECRLHTLAWHIATPDAMYAGKTREGAIEMMDSHFGKMAGAFKDPSAVDVVNEAIEDSGEMMLRDTPLKRIIGEDYVDIAYKLARKHFPKTPLVFNDYNECDAIKSKKIHAYIKGMKERGVPVDAVGFQSHHNVYEPALDDVKRAFDLFSSLGVRIQVTELDVSLYKWGDENRYESPPKELMKKQEDYYAGLFSIYREYAELLDSVTFWGVCDKESWLNYWPVNGRRNWPLLFGDGCEEKGCYNRVIDF
ncbi:MAG: endo-1,4-beta-xylanase [Defluviitaleaceae bacterium]|nr:endo-1,4-beta-xylanase [Defluviitaleaceae bacterium]